MPSTDILDVVNSHTGRRHGPAWEGDRGDDPADFNISPRQVLSGYRLDIEDRRFKRGARVVEAPSLGADGAQSPRVHWYFDGGPRKAFIRYRIRVSQMPESELVPEHWVSGFRPSSNGLHFKNNWSNVELSFTIGPVTVPLQGANNHQVLAWGLRAFDGRYVVAEGGGGRDVNVDRAQPLQWERWVVEKPLARVGDPNASGDEVHLRSDDESRLRAVGRAARVRATASAGGLAATPFRLEFVTA